MSRFKNSWLGKLLSFLFCDAHEEKLQSTSLDTGGELPIEDPEEDA